MDEKNTFMIQTFIFNFLAGKDDHFFRIKSATEIRLFQFKFKPVVASHNKLKNRETII
jgi:uncharacterized protein YlaI